MADLVLSDGNRELDLITTARDGTYLIEWNPPIVARENTYAEGADSDGRERVRSRPLNAEGSGRLRIDRTRDTAAEFWEDVDDLQDLVESAHRNKGTLRYVPPDGEAVTFDLQSIRLSSIPQPGRAPNLRLVEPEFEFECLPFGRLDSVALESAEVISGPLDSFEVLIPGHVEAWAELTLTDTSTQNADHLEVGVDLNPTASAELFGITTLVTSGFGGASTTRAGSYSANVVRATLTTAPVTLCGTGALLHVGRKKIRTRVYASSDDVYLRLAYRVGDRPFTRTAWKRVPHAGAWYDVPLAVIDLAEIPLGTHSWEGRIETYAETAGSTLDLDLLEIFPADVYAKVGTVLDIASVGAFSGRDEFDQTAGALSGKTLPIGGTWSGAGDANDFSVSGAGLLERTAVSDTSSVTGRYAIAGTATFTNVAVRVAHKLAPRKDDVQMGVFARYQDVSNWVMATRYITTTPEVDYMRLTKRVAGATTILAEVETQKQAANAFRTLILLVDAAGRAAVWTYEPGKETPTDPVLVWMDTALATGGALATGKTGIYDVSESASATTRTYDDFTVWVPEIDHTLMSGQSARFRHNTFIRENVAGTGYGKLPVEGQHLRIPPSTRSDLPRRVVIKRRRLNNDAGLPDLGLTDNLTADLTVQPRVTLLAQP